MNANTITGKALATKNRLYLFDDPRWEERFEVLIRLTQRTQLIQELTGTDATGERIKSYIDKRMADIGGEIQRPRGVGQRYTSKGFLSKTIEKYEASYLLNLHFGALGPGPSAAVETNLGAALDRRMAVYLRYRADMYDRDEEPRISFETYITMLDAIKNHAMPIHNCKNCSSRYLWTTGTAAHYSCPVCSIHSHDVKAAKKKLDALMSQRRKTTDTPAVKKVANG